MSDESVQPNLPFSGDPSLAESPVDPPESPAEVAEPPMEPGNASREETGTVDALLNLQEQETEAPDSESSAENMQQEPGQQEPDADHRDHQDDIDDKGKRDENRDSRPHKGRRSTGGRSGSGGRNRREQHQGRDQSGEKGEEGGNEKSGKSRKERYRERKETDRTRQAEALEAAPAVESEGLVEISNKGFGFLRDKGRGFQQAPKDDVFITPEIVRSYGLRDGLWVKCISKQGMRGPQLIELQTINGKTPEEYQNLPYFEELTAINPNKAYKLETIPSRNTTRVIDLLSPIGRGQRGLIVAPPRTGKTTLLHHIADAIQENYEEEVHLMVLLVDERPEEVTDFQRSFPEAEIFSSSNDSSAKDHTRMALLAIERAKRLVEAGEHVFILMDSITRLARAFNSSMRGGKRGTASGGLAVGALEAPRRIFAAARNTREAGSLTIIATALIQTNSKADEAIFQEFKGTGNMELVLDREIAQNYVYPAVDIHKSGTRREELLLAPHVLEKIRVLRRGLGGYKPVDAMEWMNKCMERYDSNAQMLMEIKLSAVS